MKTKNIIRALSFIALLLLAQHSSNAQGVVGFWEVKQVKVGDRIMTPVAKWTKISDDGIYKSGNGWLQNSIGTWSFDAKKGTFSLVEDSGIIDEFGAFKVSFSKNSMTWQREEEGMTVEVLLLPITELPKSTADELTGLWDLTEITVGDKSELINFDPNNKNYMFIRWDRIYIERTSDGARTQGFWHINGHKPELTLFSENKEEETTSWKVSISNDVLTMVGISNVNQAVKRQYARINEFPE